MADHTEKRIRREIANSNERRRMQSINTGFNSLRTMLPKHDGEKLSKAAILQHTAEYIDNLEQEKTRLLAQQYQLKRLVTSIINGQADIKDLHEHQLLKKIKIDHQHGDTDSSDEGICNASPIDAMDGTDDLKSELIEVRKTVDRERKLRMQLEDTIKTLETQLHPERVKEITHNVQVKLHHQQYEVSIDIHVHHVSPLSPLSHSHPLLSLSPESPDVIYTPLFSAPLLEPYDRANTCDTRGRCMRTSDPHPVILNHLLALSHHLIRPCPTHASSF